MSSKKISVTTYQLETEFGIFDIKNYNQIINFQEKTIFKSMV